jgi:carbonic anhydrase
MIEPIVPAVLSQRDKPGDFVENCVRANVDRVVARMRGASEPALTDPLKAGKLRVVGASYSLDTGTVDFFNEG